MTDASTSTEVDQPLPSGSAPETKKVENPDGKVEAEQRKLEQDAASQSLKGAFAQKRIAEREQRKASEENARLQARIEALEKASSSRASNGPERSDAKRPSLLDDPDAWAADVEASAEKRAFARLQQEQAQARNKTAAVEAEKFILSRSHFTEDPRLVADVVGKIQAIMAEYPDTNPKAAAKAAYLDLCEEKGIAPDLSSKTIPASHANTGFKPSRAGGGGEPKTYTPDEVKATLAKLPRGSAEAKAYKAEVTKAASEGRYKGQMIRI